MKYEPGVVINMHPGTYVHRSDKFEVQSRYARRIHVTDGALIVGFNKFLDWVFVITFSGHIGWIPISDIEGKKAWTIT